jgi:hypothetical protein
MDQISATTLPEAKRMNTRSGSKTMSSQLRETARDAGTQNALISSLKRASQSKMTGRNGAKHYRKPVSK